MSQAPPQSLHFSSISGRRALGHPKEPLMVQEEAVREGEHARAKALHHVAIEIELEDRVLVGESAVVRATPRQHPDVLPVWIGKHPADHADLPPVGHPLPAVNGVIGIVGDRLAPSLSAPHRHHNGEASHPYCRPYCHRHCHRHPFDPIGTRHLDLRQMLTRRRSSAHARPVEAHPLDAQPRCSNTRSPTLGRPSRSFLESSPE